MDAHLKRLREKLGDSAWHWLSAGNVLAPMRRPSHGTALAVVAAQGTSTIAAWEVQVGADIPHAAALRHRGAGSRAASASA